MVLLSLQVGLIQTDMKNDLKREAYQADITYVTNSEVGFDYLRDNLSYLPEALVQRDYNFCIIDEVDSILIDEARTPLIISSTASKPSGKYFKVSKEVGGALQYLAPGIVVYGNRQSRLRHLAQ